MKISRKNAQLAIVALVIVVATLTFGVLSVGADNNPCGRAATMNFAKGYFPQVLPGGQAFQNFPSWTYDDWVNGMTPTSVEWIGPSDAMACDVCANGAVQVGNLQASEVIFNGVWAFWPLCSWPSDWGFEVYPLDMTMLNGAQDFTYMGQTPCGMFDVGTHGAKQAFLSDYPACSGSDFEVACLTEDGNYTTELISDVVFDMDPVDPAKTFVTFTTARHGWCGLFPQ